MFDKTITLFNRFHSASGDFFYPHVIRNVNLNTDKASIIAKYGAQSKDSAILNMHMKSGCIGQREYVKPKEWMKLPDEIRKTKITINDDATYFDFFVEGEYPEEIVTDEDYLDGFFAYMKNEYDDIFAVTSVAIYDLIPHAEVLGK